MGADPPARSAGCYESSTTMAASEPSPGKFPSTTIAFLIGVVTLVALAVLPRLVPPVGGMIGKPAPDLVLPVAANGEIGSRMSIAALKGKPILLDFWASWCGPCAVVAPVVDRVARRYQKKGLVVVGVNVDDTPEKIRAYAQKKGLGYPMVVDDEKQSSRKYGVSTLPSLVVIDREGNVRAFLTGVVDEASLSEIVASAM
jgi:cytochrome c biogenesis protein CcmG, thiol:disulfide interchange protein DsbE